jgi:hypothetical protein
VAEAVNDSEQFVYDICSKSFLSLWSYINPQGKTPGKELCDVLVVCNPHVRDLRRNKLPVILEDSKRESTRFCYKSLELEARE